MYRVASLMECPICHKNFIKASANIYKVRCENKVKHLCSYSCMNKAKSLIAEGKVFALGEML